MTSEKVIKQVREKIARELLEMDTLPRPKSTRYGEFADRILSIPGLHIEHPDQSLPERIYYWDTDKSTIQFNTPTWLIEWLRINNWVEVLPKEKK